MAPVAPRPRRPLRSPGILLLAGLAWALAAPPPLAHAAAPDSSLAGALETLRGAPLALAEARRLAAQQDPALLAAAAAWEAAAAAARREAGAFEPGLYARYLRREDDSPSASPFAGADVVETQSTLLSGGARVELPVGTRLEAGVSSLRGRTNSAFATLDPQVDVSGELRLTQPLLDGFGPANRGARDAARRAADRARLEYEQAALALRAAVAIDYWQLYAAERDLAVLVLSRDRAAALLREARLRQEAGLVGPNQVANARVFLAQQELALLDGRDRLATISDRLAARLGQRPATGPWFHASDEPPVGRGPGDLEPLLEVALSANRQLAAAERRVSELDALVAAGRWGALPRLDLSATLGGHGLSGSGQDVSFGGTTFPNDTDGGFGPAWAQVRDGDYPFWSVGLELDLPLTLATGRGERDRLRAERRRAESLAEQLRRQVEAELRAAHRELAQGPRRVELAAEGVAASREQVRIGDVEYRNGRSTAFELVRLNADLADAQRRYSDALVRSAIAAARLELLTATGNATAAPTDREDGR